jgi:hypothetical protein
MYNEGDDAKLNELSYDGLMDIRYAAKDLIERIDKYNETGEIA